MKIFKYRVKDIKGTTIACGSMPYRTIIGLIKCYKRADQTYKEMKGYSLEVEEGK